jgi:NAD(P)H-hydrate epimerase
MTRKTTLAKIAVADVPLGNVRYYITMKDALVDAPYRVDPDDGERRAQPGSPGHRSVRAGKVTVLAGPGGNGGGGLVAARHLINRGRTVAVVLSEPDSLTPVSAHQADILVRMGAAMATTPVPADLIVDALIGYSLRGDPTGRAAELIEWTNGQAAPVLALDAPSELDVTTGIAGTPHIRATTTLTLALPKVGLIGAAVVGELYLADISVPAIVYQRLGLRPPQLFGDDAVVRLS